MGSTVPVSTERINIFFTRRYFVVKKRIGRKLRSTCVRHHRRSKHSCACLRSTTSNCCAQLFQNSSLSFLSVYAPAIRSSPTISRTDSFSPFILYSSRNLFILENDDCHLPLWNSKGSSDIHGEEVFDWVISSDLFPLNNPDIPILAYYSPSLLLPLSPSLALGKYFRTWVLTIYQF